MDLVLESCLTKGLESIPERSDARDGKLHVSDVANGCLRDVWHRKKFGLLRAWGPQERVKFAFGYSAEQIWKQHGEPALLEMGWTFVKTVDEGTEVDGVIGHEDFLYEQGERRKLIEVKSTVWFDGGRYVPYLPEPEILHAHSRNYFIQAAKYAQMHGAQEASVFVFHRGSGKYREYPVNIAQEMALYDEREAIFKKALSEEIEPDPIVPGWTINAKSQKSYLCSMSCPVITCEKHPAENK